MLRINRLAIPVLVVLGALGTASAASATATVTTPALDSVNGPRPTFTWSNDAPADVVTSLRVYDSCTPLNVGGAVISQVTYLNESHGNDAGYVNIANPIVPDVDLNAGFKCAQLVYQHPNGKPAGESQWDGIFGPTTHFTVAPVVRKATTSTSRYFLGSKHVVSGYVRITSNLMAGKVRVLVKSGSKTIATVSVTGGQWTGARQTYSGSWTWKVKAAYNGKKVTFQPQVLAQGKALLGTKRTITA